MAGVDLQLKTDEVFSRLKSDAAGAVVRVALGDGANSVIHAQQLSLGSLPATPFLALRAGPVAGRSYDMRIPTWTWWLYDDPSAYYWRINGLVPLIEAAYPRGSIAFGAIEVANIGGETVDDALNLLVRTVQLAFYTRG